MQPIFINWNIKYFIKKNPFLLQKIISYFDCDKISRYLKILIYFNLNLYSQMKFLILNSLDLNKFFHHPLVFFSTHHFYILKNLNG